MDQRAIGLRALGERCCEGAATPRIDGDALEGIISDLQILGHPVRMQILDVLAQSEGQVCVCDLEAALPVKQPTISHHLKLLREAGLVDCERRGQWAYYFVAPKALAALRSRIVARLDTLIPALV
jgi:ArsR family transcriptional regulator